MTPRQFCRRLHSISIHVAINYKHPFLSLLISRHLFTSTLRLGLILTAPSALMTHTVNMLDIYHPAQHLVFVFSMPQNGSLRGLSVCATSPVFGNEEMNEGGAVRRGALPALCTQSRRATVFPSYQGIERALNSIVTLLLCSSR